MHDIFKIMIVDDHPIFRKGLAALINDEDNLMVCGEADNVNQARKAVLALNPDLVITGIIFKERSGLELIRDLKTNHPELPVFVISMYDESVYAAKVLGIGARGYITKHEMPDLVIQALNHVLAGNVYAGKDVIDNIIFKFSGGGSLALTNSPVEILSNRELEVFHLTGKGFCRKKIADNLNLSVKTIGTYRESIKKKLNIKSSPELMKRAVEWNLDPS